MRTMGLDVGTKTVGIAVSDETGLFAQPHSVVTRTTPEADAGRINELAMALDVGRIVVGMPRNMNGTYGPSAKLVWEFIGQLENWVRLPVEIWDERMTTVMATRALVEANVRRGERKKLVDKVAAAVILQSYLDSINNAQCQNGRTNGH